jgi:hypothetical protein
MHWSSAFDPVLLSEALPDRKLLMTETPDRGVASDAEKQIAASLNGQLPTQQTFLTLRYYAGDERF